MDWMSEFVSHAGAFSTITELVLIVAAWTEISTSSESQSRGVKEIDEVVENLNESTKGNVTAAEQSSQSAESLADQAHEFHDLVSQLSSLIEGGDGSARAPTPVKAVAPQTKTAIVSKIVRLDRLASDDKNAA
jgi:hypothetical protein